jgi:hypothetical protein
MRLNDAQIRHFKTFGYLGIPDVFPPEDVAWIIEEFEAAIARSGGDKHDGTKRTIFGAPSEQSAKLRTLLDDPRVTDILGSILGDDYNYLGGDGNYYSGDTAWHPDGSWGKCWFIKLAFYLDPLTRDTGCLRVIPGSQDPDHPLRKSKNTSTPIDPNKSMELFGVPPRDYPGNVPLETKPGDLVVFNHDTYHAAFGGSARRRMFTMNCGMRGQDDQGAPLARKYLSIHAAGLKMSPGGLYVPQTVSEASPQRMVHLQEAIDLHREIHEQHLKEQARSTSATPAGVA